MKLKARGRVQKYGVVVLLWNNWCRMARADDFKTLMVASNDAEYGEEVEVVRVTVISKGV